MAFGCDRSHLPKYPLKFLGGTFPSLARALARALIYYVKGPGLGTRLVTHMSPSESAPHCLTSALLQVLGRGVTLSFNFNLSV